MGSASVSLDVPRTASTAQHTLEHPAGCDVTAGQIGLKACIINTSDTHFSLGF